MKIRLVSLLVVVLFAGVGSYCTPAPPNLSPQASIAFTNTRVQKALDLIRDTAQDANAQAPPLLSTATTRKVTLFHESAIKIIHTAGTGWQSTVRTSLDELLKDVPPAEVQLLTPYVALAKTIIAEVK